MCDLEKESLRRRVQSGQGMLEYILLVVLVVLVGVAAWRAFGSNVKKLVSDAANELLMIEVPSVTDNGGGSGAAAGNPGESADRVVP